MTNDERKAIERISRVRSAAGRRGGLNTLARHGRDHFKKIGREGARVFHERYVLIPVLQNDFAIVDRRTNLTKAFLSGMKIQE